MKLLRFSCVAFLGFAACSNPPTEPAAFDAAPRFAEELGPNMMGSGTFQEGTNDQAGSDGDLTLQSTVSDTTERGGNGLGSGN